MDQSHQLKGWYETEGSTAHITALSTSNRGGGGASADFSSGSNMKTFGEAKQVWTWFLISQDLNNRPFWDYNDLKYLI